MKINWKLLTVATAAVGLIGCGGETGADDGPECGENTVEQDGECVVEVDDCGDGEVLEDETGQCVRAADDFCGEGTNFDDDRGQCVGTEMECDDETDEQDGECVAEDGPLCGENTVVEDGVCKPADEVCGEGGEWSDSECRAGDGVCGEGTVYDIDQQRCVPDQDLECGSGTIEKEVDGDLQCIPKAVGYDEMADDPDLDMTGEEGIGEIDVGEAGERFVFTGRIDEPTIEEDEPVQDYDRYSLEADEGQWLEVTVYSLGLPEPGFRFSETVEEGFERLSDVGAGIEVSRDILVRGDGSYELTVSNLAQMLETAPPAGGDDWNYVGYVEPKEAPDAQDFDLLEDTATGDIRELSDNYYSVDADGIGAVAMIFDEIPEDTSGELQVWTDETTHDATIELGDEAFSYEPPEDEFYLAFDRGHAHGPSVDYTASAAVGQPLDAGQSLTTEVELEEGDYAGLFQFNLAGQALEGRIVDEDDTILESSASLEVSNAPDGQLGLYHYAESATPVSLEVENTSGEDLGFVSLEPHVGTSDVVDGIDGARVESQYDETLPRAHRHYYQLGIDYDDDLAVRIEEAAAETEVTLYDEAGDVFADGRNTALFEAQPGDYLLEVDAMGTLGDGFLLAAEEAELFEVSETSQPSVAIPDNDPEGVEDTLSIDACPFIDDIEVELNISHGWRNDLIVSVESPAGDEAVLHDRDGGSGDDINATYPNPDDIELASGDDLYDMIGSNGSGTWTIEVSDNELGVEGTLDSWTVTLTCEG